MMHERTKTMPHWSAAAIVAIVALGVGGAMFLLVQQNRELKATLAVIVAGYTEAPGAPAGDDLYVGARVPDLDVESPNGEVASLREVMGDGGVMAILTTTCPFCERTVPIWDTIGTELASGGRKWVALSLHPRAATDLYQDRLAIEWPLLTIASNDQWLVRAVPVTLVYDAEGKIVRVWRGQLRATQIEEIRGAVTSLVDDR